MLLDLYNIWQTLLWYKQDVNIVFVQSFNPYISLTTMEKWLAFSFLQDTVEQVQESEKILGTLIY